MIIPNSNIVTHFTRPAILKAPMLKFEVAGESELTRKIECIRADSLKGLYKRLKSRGSPKKNYTSLTVTQETDSKGFFKSRKVKVLLKNKDLKKLIGKAEFKRLQTLDSFGKFLHIKRCVGPLNPLDGRCKPQKGSPPSDWQKLSLQINNKLKTLFPNKLESEGIKKVRRAVNKMIVSKDTSIFALVDVKVVGKKEQIFLRKHKGELLIELPKTCGEGGNATVYKVAGYALKKFRQTDYDPVTDIPRVNAKDVEEEIEACNDVKTIPRTLKVTGKLNDVESDSLIGYVMKAYDGDFRAYLSTSLDSPNRIRKLCKNFIELSETFTQMHKIDKVHNDIKLENVFANFDQKGISKLVVGDIGKTDPKDTCFSTTPEYTFLQDIAYIKSPRQTDPGANLTLRKQLDVRQFAFFMYYSICAEKPDRYKGIKLPQAFPVDDFKTFPKDFPTVEERLANYTPIPKEKAPRALRDFIEYLLTEDFKKLPSMEAVHEKLKEIYSIQSSKLLR